MKLTILVLFLSAMLVGCSKNDKEHDTQNACKSADPLEVSWIKEIKNSLTNCSCEISIIQGTYDGQTVFFTALTDPACDGIDTPTLYNCNGNIVRIFTMHDYTDFYTKVTRDNVLYRCKTTR